MNVSLSNQKSWMQLASVSPGVKRVILHVHRNPSTGVWSMMKHLASAQNKIPGCLSILGIPADREWISSGYRSELLKVDSPYALAPVPKIFGTGAFLLSIVSNPVRKWVKQIRHAFPAADLVIHSHSAWLTGGYLPLHVKGRSALVATFHGIADDHRLRKTWWLRTAHCFLAQRLYHSQAVLTSVSKDTSVRAEDIFGIPRDAFTVVPNGMTCPNHSPSGILMKNGELLVGHVGQMHEGKGWRLLLEAVDRMRQKGKAIQLVIAGKGQDTELAREEAAKRKEYVTFLGVVPNASEGLIPQLDALVLATWSEGMPMSIIEAFAAGVPVIATAVGGIPEMVEDNSNGFIIRRDSDSITEALNRFFDDSKLGARLSIGALKTFQAKFEISQVVSKYNSVYDAALDSNLKKNEAN